MGRPMGFPPRYLCVILLTFTLLIREPSTLFADKANKTGRGIEKETHSLQQRVHLRNTQKGSIKKSISLAHQVCPPYTKDGGTTRLIYTVR
jgi:hypothetical protein